jgi:hypothetical protein
MKTITTDKGCFIWRFSAKLRSRLLPGLGAVSGPPKQLAREW